MVLGLPTCRPGRTPGHPTRQPNRLNMIRSNAAQRERIKARCDQPGAPTAAISTRERKPVFWKTCETWVCTVRGDRNSRCAICGFVKP